MKISKDKTERKNNQEADFGWSEASNPLTATKSNIKNALSDYSQEIPRPKYDSDINEVIEVVRILNNIAPLRMPVYNFNLDEINGEYFYKPDGSLLLVREYDRNVIRDYYVQSANADNEYSINRILEHDKTSGRLKAKIEPIEGHGSKLKTSVMIFDLKLNNKYTLMQLTEDGYVNNITEFTGEGKSFRTLFRNIDTFKPARYLEGKDSKEIGFSMLDCIFSTDGSIVRIKRYLNKKEICIDYTKEKKNITVKTG